jgi:hypothetical protein
VACAAAVLLVAGCGTGPVVEAIGPAALPPAAAPVVHPTRPARPATASLPAGCSPRAVACVSTTHHVAWLQQAGHPSYGPVPVATGGPAQRTPHGTFHVVWKDAEHTSSTYGTDMPFSVFFAAGGIAFHTGPLDEPSHGCVHLPAAAAPVFFAGLARGDRVEVF